MIDAAWVRDSLAHVSRQYMSEWSPCSQRTCHSCSRPTWPTAFPVRLTLNTRTLLQRNPH